MLTGIVVLNVVGILFAICGIMSYVATISNWSNRFSIGSEMILVCVGICCLYASWELRNIDKCVIEKSIVLPKSSKLVYKVNESVVETDDYYYRDGIYLRKTRL